MQKDSCGKLAEPTYTLSNSFVNADYFSLIQKILKLKIKTRLLSLVLVLLVSQTLSGHNRPNLQTDPEMIRKAWVDVEIPHIYVVAHRANSTFRNNSPNTPENSLQGIENAIRLGVDIVEVDLKQTSDGHFILMHDQRVDRTTDGFGEVADMTLEEIRELRLIHDGMVTEHIVPTLEESLEVVRNRAMINLDHIDPFMEEALAVVEDMGLLDHVIVKSRDDPEVVVNRLSDFNLDEVRYMPVISGHRFIDIRLLERIEEYDDMVGISAVELTFTENSLFRMTEDLFRTIHEELGIRVWINTLWNGRLAGGLADENIPMESEDTWGKLIDKGVTIVQTDKAAFMRAYLTSPFFGSGLNDEGDPTGIIPEESVQNPAKYILKQNYPNPFNPSTNIDFEIQESGHVVLEVFDVLGRNIKTLVDDYRFPGTHSVEFDGTGLSTGIYLYSLTAGSFSESRTMILVK